MIRDPNVSKAEKDLAQKQLEQLDTQEKKAQTLAFFTGGIAVPGLNISSRGSGAASRAREENSPFIQLQRLNKITADSTKQMADDTAEMHRVIKSNPEAAHLLTGI